MQVHEMEMIVSGELMRKLVGMVDRVAPTPCAVLITGETGSGKELIARAIHSRSLRCGKPWVDVNCAALPEHLVESELFGYEKGAFSGADSPKAGLFELADKGTLFLDEVGELEPKIQVKLLRVLDGVPYYRLGGRHKISVDVRIIAATNRPLDEAVRFGRFRADLYHRLTQFELRVPPLRERPEDIEALAEYFLQQCSKARLREDTLRLLLAYSWPGNVRELRNVIIKAAVMARDSVLAPEDLPTELLRALGTGPHDAVAGSAVPKVPTDLGELERHTILHTLEKVNGHQGQAAELLGISRRTLSRKLKQYRIAGAERLGSSSEAPLGSLSKSEEQHFRVDVQIPITILDNEGKELQCDIQNVSVGGVALEKLDNPFRLAKPFNFSFVLPEGPSVETQGRIVWADVRGRAGVRFVDLPPATSQALRAWLQACQKAEGWETGG